MLWIYLIGLLLGAVPAMKVIPETVAVSQMNDKYVKWAKFNIRRYERRGDYYLNINAFLIHPWGNNVTIHVAMTEYLHNEYRPSFIQFSFKTCELINKEPYIGSMLKKAGIVCPVPSGELRLNNMTVQTQNFAYKFPFTKGGTNVEFKLTDTGELLGRVEYHAKFVQESIKKT